MPKEVFQLVGKPVEKGDVSLSNEDVAAFREIALSGLKLNEHSMDEHTDTTKIITSSFTDGIITERDLAADYDVYSLMFRGETVMSSDPDRARITVTLARYNLANQGLKIYNIYDVHSLEGETVMAARRVRIIRELSRLTFDEIGQPFLEKYDKQWKAYEVPMTSQDVEYVGAFSGRLAKRVSVTGGH